MDSRDLTADQLKEIQEVGPMVRSPTHPLFMYKSHRLRPGTGVRHGSSHSTESIPSIPVTPTAFNYTCLPPLVAIRLLARI